MGGCQINFTVSFRDLRSGAKKEEELLWFCDPLTCVVNVLAGGCWFHRLQWRSQISFVAALHQSSGFQRIPVGYLVCRQRHPGLRQVRVLSVMSQRWKRVIYVINWNVLSCFSFLFSDKMFPAFGFGAQIPPSYQVKWEVTNAFMTLIKKGRYLHGVCIRCCNWAKGCDMTMRLFDSTGFPRVPSQFQPI